MAHLEQLTFVSLIPKHFGPFFKDGRVLEIGSYDVNGSVRKFFPGEYVGADLTEGPGVDIVKSGHEVDYPDGHFDLAISCECFEHNPYWLDTFTNMIRMTKPGGLVVFTCASAGRLEHGTSRTNLDLSPGTASVGLDYYRNLVAEDFERSVALDKEFQFWRFFNVRSSHDLYFIGIKKGAPLITPVDIPTLERDIAAIEKVKMKSMGAVKYAAYLLYRLPLTLGHVLLSDKWYQTLGITYVKLCRSIFRRDGIQSY